MKFENIFLNIISEAVQSVALQKVIDAIKNQYKEESNNARVQILKRLCEKVSRIAEEYIEDKFNKYQFSKKDKLVLYALKDFSKSLYKTAEEKANLVNEKLTEKEAFTKIILPSVEEEYGVNITSEISDKIIDELSEYFSDSYRQDYHEKSNTNKKLLDYFFKQIDAANITDDDVIEVSNINELSRKAKGTYSIIAGFNNSTLIGIVYFNDDGTKDFVQTVNTYHFNKPITMAELSRRCNHFIAVKRKSSAINKKIERDSNRKYIKSKTYEEEKYENQRRYRRIKQDKINKERRDAQQNKIMQVLAEAKEAVKTYDPEFETEESTEIINAYKSLKKYINASYESGAADMYIDTIKNNIEKLKKDAGVAE